MSDNKTKILVCTFNITDTQGKTYISNSLEAITSIRVDGTEIPIEEEIEAKEVDFEGNPTGNTRKEMHKVNHYTFDTMGKHIVEFVLEDDVKELPNSSFAAINAPTITEALLPKPLATGIFE